MGYYNSEDCIFGSFSKLSQRGSSNYADIYGVKLTQIVYSFLYSFLFSFSFSIRYKVGIRFRFRFFKYTLYSKVLVLLVFSYNKLTLLLSARQYSTQSLFVGFSGNFKSLIDIGGSLILAELDGLLRYRVDVNRNFGLVDLSGFFRFQFRVLVVSYKALLLIIGGGKYKLKVVLINDYLIQLYLGLFKNYQVTQGGNKKPNQFFMVQVLESQVYYIGNSA